MWTNIRKQEIFIIKVTETREKAHHSDPSTEHLETCWLLSLGTKCLHYVSIPASKNQLKLVQVTKENSLERHWGSSQKSKRLQEIRITSFQVYHQKRKRLFFQFQSENPRTFYLMVLIWVTCQPQEQSLWPKRARLLSEKGGVGAKHWPPGEFSFWYPRKGHRNQLWFIRMSFL